MADIKNITCEIRRRRWHWLGHVLKKEDENGLFYSFRIDTGGSKGVRETKDHLEKDCREGERQSRVEELESCGMWPRQLRETESVGQRA